MDRPSTRKRESRGESYLFVKQSSKSTFGKVWKKKFVIIRKNKGSSGKSVLLELYIEKDAHHKPVVSMLLEGVDSIVRLPSKVREHAFEIKSGDKTKLSVATESETETFEWMENFHQHLLEPIQELENLPDNIGNDFCKVSVIPNKDSQRLDLKGDYYAVIKEMNVFLHDPCTGQMIKQWDMRHLKKVLVTTKCHFRDKEKIMHFVVSNRSEHGKAEIHFFSLQARRLADTIFQTLNGAISVTSRQTRSASMVFEITAKDLKRMMVNRDPDTESVASMAIESTKEEERSVQTIPEEMGPNSASKESPKEEVKKDEEAVKEEIENDPSVDEKEKSSDSAEKVDSEIGEVSVQSNGHGMENADEGTITDDANVRENEIDTSRGTEEEGSPNNGAREDSDVDISKKEDSGEINESNDNSNSGIETGVAKEEDVPESEVQNNHSANESTTLAEEAVPDNDKEHENKVQEAKKETDEPEQHDVANGEESSSLQETSDRVSSPERVTLNVEQPSQSQLDQSQLDQSQPDQSQPDQSQPDQSQPDQSQPDQSQPDQSQPDQSQPDQSQPDQSQPDQSQPDQSQPDQSQPDQSQPDQSQPDQSQPDQSQPDQSQPDQSQPDQSQPDQSQPDQSQPDQTQPDQSQPDQTQPDQSQPDQSQPDQSQTDQSQLDQSLESKTEDANDLEMPNENEELVSKPAGEEAEVIAELKNSEQSSGNEAGEESEELTTDSSPADLDSKVNGSAAIDGQHLAHDTSTDSGFINDAGDTGNNIVSVNTNNNNSRESLNCMMEENGNGLKQDVETSDIFNHDSQDSTGDKEKMQSDVLPEFGLPVDVADLEEISVIVYSEDSPEVLV